MNIADLVDYVSPSRLGVWLRCQQQWAFIYIERLRRAPNAAIAYGNAFDSTADQVYLAKLGFGDTPSADDAASIFAAAWDIDSEKVEDWQGADRGELLDEGVALAAHWRERVAVHVKPNRLQVPVALDLVVPTQHHEANARLGVSNGFRMRGYADMVAEIEGRDVVVDHKASAKSWSAVDVIRSTQATFYGSALNVPWFQLHVARRTRKPTVQILGRRVRERDLQYLVHETAIARRQIARACQTGDFIPNRQQPMCSKRWCAFWRECVAKHGGVVPD